MDFDHNKLIAEAAKQVLLPVGLKRKGKSRLYYDDNGWWCTIVGFQPSGFSKGSYLNVGVSWFLYERDFWAFDVSSRVQGFSSAEDGTDFKDAVLEKAKRAKETVEENREKFSTIAKANEFYNSIKRTGWGYYYAAVIAGMNHQSVSAAQNFRALLAYPEVTDWEKERGSRTRELIRLMEHPKEFMQAVIGIVMKSRSLHGLENREPAQLGLPSVEDF